MTDEGIAAYAAARMALPPRARLRTEEERFWVTVLAHERIGARIYYAQMRVDRLVLLDRRFDMRPMAARLREEWDHSVPGYRCEHCERQVRTAHALGRWRAEQARLAALP
jgi:hypothetical protein